MKKTNSGSREMFTLEIRRIVVPVKRGRYLDSDRRASVERVGSVMAPSKGGLRSVVRALKKARFDVPRPLLKQFALGGR